MSASPVRVVGALLFVLVLELTFPRDPVTNGPIPTISLPIPTPQRPFSLHPAKRNFRNTEIDAWLCELLHRSTFCLAASPVETNPDPQKRVKFTVFRHASPFCHQHDHACSQAVLCVPQESLAGSAPPHARCVCFAFVLRRAWPIPRQPLAVAPTFPIG